nr:hypothetical protein [uncultured Gordonia sp.]
MLQVAPLAEIPRSPDLESQTSSLQVVVVVAVAMVPLQRSVVPEEVAAVGTTSQPTSREQQVLRAKDTQGEAVPTVGLVPEAEVPVLPEATSQTQTVGQVARVDPSGEPLMAEAVEGVTDPRQPIPTTPVALVEVVMVSEPMVLLVLLALQTLAAEEAAAGKDLALVLAVLVVRASS